MKFFNRGGDKPKDAAHDTSAQQPTTDATAAPEKKGLFGWRRESTPAPQPAPPIQPPAPESVSPAQQPVPSQSVAPAPVAPAPPPAAVNVAAAPTNGDEGKKGFFSRLKQGLSRTSNAFSSGLGTLFLGKKEIDDDLLENIETQLIVADVGIDATRVIVDNLTQRVSRKELEDADSLYVALREQLEQLLVPCEAPLVIDTAKKPYVILIVGVNGVGKTTTIGKLAKRFQRDGKSVMLAAGDTFRAAAVEQLQVWGDRNNVQVIAQHTGADSASVIFDAIAAAQSRGIDIVIADTAGRLHNKDNLMEELKKVVRVMKKLDAAAPHEVMLVLDAGTGQNALTQAKHFQQAVGVTGLTLTKLDGTAKGGIIFAICKQLGLPIRFIGVGETIDDLRPFGAKDFAKALFNQDS
jgi:fused signal recognition particle receptor